MFTTAEIHFREGCTAVNKFPKTTVINLQKSLRKTRNSHGCSGCTEKCWWTCNLSFSVHFMVGWPLNFWDILILSPPPLKRRAVHSQWKYPLSKSIPLPSVLNRSTVWSNCIKNGHNWKPKVQATRSRALFLQSLYFRTLRIQNRDNFPLVWYYESHKWFIY